MPIFPYPASYSDAQVEALREQVPDGETSALMKVPDPDPAPDAPPQNGYLAWAGTPAPAAEAEAG